MRWVCLYCTIVHADWIMSYLESKSRLPISEFSGYHCRLLERTHSETSSGRPM